MSELFRRQLIDYVEYHRDPLNGLLHVVGIVCLFLAAVLPLSLWHIDAFGAQISLSVAMALPVLIYWLLLDKALGTAILGAAVLLLLAAKLIVEHIGMTTMWSLFATLLIMGVGAQVVGHQVFERRQPSLVDNPTHLLLGPPFVMAKLFIALGFRRDLAAIIEPKWPANSLSSDHTRERTNS
jgi:uncharacterized membrane protein YGL010W